MTEQTPAEIADVQVTRLSPFALEVTRGDPRKPWRVALGVYQKRRDAERRAELEKEPRHD